MGGSHACRRGEGVLQLDRGVGSGCTSSCPSSSYYYFIFVLASSSCGSRLMWFNGWLCNLAPVAAACGRGRLHVRLLWSGAQGHRVSVRLVVTLVFNSEVASDGGRVGGLKEMVLTVLHLEGRASGRAGRRKGGERGRCTVMISSSSRLSVSSRPPPPLSYIACDGACIIWSNGELYFCASCVWVEGKMRCRGKRGCRCPGKRAAGAACCANGAVMLMWRRLAPTLVVERAWEVAFCGAWGGERLRGGWEG